MSGRPQGEDERRADGDRRPAPGADQNRTDNRLDGEEEVVEALVVGVEGVWTRLLGGPAEGLARRRHLPGDGLHPEDEDVDGCGERAAARPTRITARITTPSPRSRRRR